MRSNRTLKAFLAGRHYWIWPILVLALAVRWGGMDKPLFHDEWRTLVTLGGDFTPNLLWQPQLWLAHLARALEPWGSPLALRLPYLAIGLLTIWLGWRLGRIWRDWPAGVLLAVALAVWPFGVYWNTMLREYSALLFFGLATLTAWECYRLRPNLARCLIALAATALTAFIHELAPIILVFPAVYLIWELLRIAFAAARRRAFDRPRASAFAIEAVLTGALILVLAGHFTGINFREMFVARLTAPTTESAGSISFDDSPSTATQTQAPAAPPGAPPALQPRLPSAREAAAFAGEGVRGVFADWPWSPLPLLDLRKTPAVFAELLAGPTDRPMTYVSPLLFGLAVIGALLGSLALLRRSPPLLLALWGIIIANALLVSFNRHLRPDPAARYFTLAGLAGLVLAVSAVAEILRVARGLAGRRRAVRIWLTFVPVLLVAVAAAALLVRRDAESARFFSANWLDPTAEGVFRIARDRFPHGALVLGPYAENWQWLSRFEANAARRAGDDPWRSPDRNLFLESYHHRWLIDFNMADRLNNFEGLMLYQSRQAETIRSNPFRRLAQLFDFTEEYVRGNRIMIAPIGNRVFIMRGQAAFQLTPRLLDAATTHSAGQTFRLNAVYEVPGVYEIGLAMPADAGTVEVAVDGRRIELTTRALAAADMGTARVLPPSVSAPPSPVRSYADVAANLAAGGGPAPFPGDATEFVGRYTTSPFAIDPPGQTIEIRTQAQALTAERAPVLRMAYLDRWSSCSELFDAGTPQLHENADGFFLGLPLRARDVPTSPAQVHLYLEEASSREPLDVTHNPLYARREIAPGDMFWVGWSSVSRESAAQVAGRAYILRFAVRRLDPLRPESATPDRHFERRRGVLSQSESFLVCLLRFVTVDGRAMIQLGLPEGQGELEIARLYGEQE